MFFQSSANLIYQASSEPFVIKYGVDSAPVPAGFVILPSHTLVGVSAEAPINIEQQTVCNIVTISTMHKRNDKAFFIFNYLQH